MDKIRNTIYRANRKVKQVIIMEEDQMELFGNISPMNGKLLVRTSETERQKITKKNEAKVGEKKMERNVENKAEIIT